MDVLITLFYILFVICVVYPPTEFITAGFTIAQIFENYLGSENMNFVAYHMKRTSITAFIHSALPLGYVFCLFVAGDGGDWLLASAAATAIIPLLMCYRLLGWWENNSFKHPVLKSLVAYVTPGSDWRVIAADLNTEFKNVDKVLIPLTANSKFVATQTWFIKVNLYSLQAVKQEDCTLVATAELLRFISVHSQFYQPVTTSVYFEDEVVEPFRLYQWLFSTDSHILTPSGEEEVQYVNIESIPRRDDIERFTFRISTTALRDLQPRLAHPVQVPEHIMLMPTLIERFITVFKQYVDRNPIYYVDQELELCIGCMQYPADVKLTRRCLPPPPHLEGGPPQCQQCNCRALWCAACIARWWAARAQGPPQQWLGGRCTCPVCRAPFCLLDVCPARPTPP